MSRTPPTLPASKWSEAVGHHRAKAPVKMVRNPSVEKLHRQGFTTSEIMRLTQLDKFQVESVTLGMRAVPPRQEFNSNVLRRT